MIQSSTSLIKIFRFHYFCFLIFPFLFCDEDTFTQHVAAPDKTFPVSTDDPVGRIQCDKWQFREQGKLDVTNTQQIFFCPE